MGKEKIIGYRKPLNKCLVGRAAFSPPHNTQTKEDGGLRAPKGISFGHKPPYRVMVCGYTDIQLKTLSRRVEVFNMKIIMRRDFMIF